MNTYVCSEIFQGKIFHIYYDKNGIKRSEITNYKPFVGIEHKNTTLYTDKIKNADKWTDMDGKQLTELRFDNSREYFDFLRTHTFHKGTDFEEQEFPIYGDINPKYQFLSEVYPYDYKPNNDLFRKLLIDIEVYSEEGFPYPEIAAWPITSIALKDEKTGKYYVCSSKEYKPNLSILQDVNIDKITFKKVKDDKEILKWLSSTVEYVQPDILVGWNSDGFDVPYVLNRYDFIFDDEVEKRKLSPVGVAYTEQVGYANFRNRIVGITLYDYMKLYKKFIFTPRQSYSLDNICKAEEVGTKLDYSGYDNLFALWVENPQLYIDYNIQDIELISLLDKKLGLIKLGCTIAGKTKCCLADVLGTVSVWDCSFYNQLKEEDSILVPPKKVNQSAEFAGAFVMEPVTKVYKYGISYDLNSLYPHIQMQWGISPDTLVDGLSESVSIDQLDKRLLNREIEVNKNYAMAGNGQYFRKDKIGFMPRKYIKLYAERSEIKQEMLKQEQELENLENYMKKRGVNY